MTINVSDAKKSLPFYSDLLLLLGYKIVSRHANSLGFSNGTLDIWVSQTESKYLNRKFHRKATGLNHLCFRVASQKAVDEFTKKFLIKKRLKPLYNSPRIFPQYTKGYYAVYFEDPDRIKIEVSHIPHRYVKSNWPES